MRYVVSGHLRQPGTLSPAEYLTLAVREWEMVLGDSPQGQLSPTAGWARAGGAVLLDVPTELEPRRAAAGLPLAPDAAVEVRASGPWRLARDWAAALGPPALRSTPAAAAMSRLRPAS